MNKTLIIMVTMVTLVIIKILTLFNDTIYLVTVVTLVTFLLGCEWCMLGCSDEQDFDYYGNLGNSVNFESNCSSLKIN